MCALQLRRAWWWCWRFERRLVFFPRRRDRRGAGYRRRKRSARSVGAHLSRARAPVLLGTQKRRTASGDRREGGFLRRSGVIGRPWRLGVLPVAAAWTRGSAAAGDRGSAPPRSRPPSAAPSRFGTRPSEQQEEEERNPLKTAVLYNWLCHSCDRLACVCVRGVAALKQEKRKSVWRVAST